jgi:hypothetical protein
MMIERKESVHIISEKFGTNGETVEIPAAIIIEEKSTKRPIVFQLVEMNAEQLATLIVEQRVENKKEEKES